MCFSALCSVVLALALAVACLVCGILGIIDMQVAFWQVLVSVTLGMALLSTLFFAKYVSVVECEA